MAGVDLDHVTRISHSVERIADPADPRIAEYRDLKEPALRRARGVFVAEGRFIVRRLIDVRRFEIRSLLLTESALRDLGDVVDGLDGPVFVAPTAILRRVVGYDFHHGCLAAAARGVDTGAEPLLEPPGARILLVLEHLTDPYNVGAAFRNAMAFGVDAVLLFPGCADPLYRKAIRTSSGTTLAVPFARFEDWRGGLARMRQAGYRLIGLTPNALAVDIASLETSANDLERVALVVGTEGEGLTPDTLAAVDLAVRIPMAAGVDSLNVATACGIALHRLHASRARPRA